MVPIIRRELKRALKSLVNERLTDARVYTSFNFPNTFKYKQKMNALVTLGQLFCLKTEHRNTNRQKPGGCSATERALGGLHKVREHEDYPVRT